MASDWVRGDKIRKTVILDSSALLMFFVFLVDWETQLKQLIPSYQIVVPVAVINELDLLSRHGSGEKKRKAKAALEFSSRFTTVETKTTSADEATIETAKVTEGVVFTNDSALRRRLRDEGIPVLLLRGRKKLMLVE